MKREWHGALPEQGRRNRFRRGLLIGGLGTILSGVLVALIVGLLVPVIKEWLWPPLPTRAAQLEEVRHDIAVNGGRTTFSKKADLHGANVGSQILVLTTRGGGSELWILDEDDGRLHNEFRFRPGHLAPLPGTRPGRYGMEVADISDLDEDGAEEIVLLLQPQWRIAKGGGMTVLRRGSIGLLGLGAPDMQIPVLIRWNHEANEYGLQPLIAEEPRYPIVPFYGPQKKARSEFYRRPYRLTDPESSKQWLAYGAQVARVMRNGMGQPFLLTAYPARWSRRLEGPYGFSFTPDPNCGPPVEIEPGVLASPPCAYAVGPGTRPHFGPDVLSLSAGRIDTVNMPLVRSCTVGGLYFIKAGIDPVRETERAWRRLLRRSAC